MFPKELQESAKLAVGLHTAITFLSEFSNLKVTRLLKEKGIAGFIAPDLTAPNNNNSYYKDDRIAGLPTYAHNSQCCAFTKDATRWYLFPFTKAELDGVGIKEEDLIAWVTLLNDMKVGFKYLYLGEQTAPQQLFDRMGNSRSAQRWPDNKAYWVAVPRLITPALNKATLKSYYHWICLRYLINYSKPNLTSCKAYSSLPYFNIPRLVYIFINDYGLDAFKAFLYAQICFPWMAYYGFTYTDSINYKDSPTPTYSIPDAGITAAEFKALWAEGSGGAMNNLVTSSNSTAQKAGLRLPVGKHDPLTLYAFNHSRNYQGMIDYLEKCYSEKPTVKRAYVRKTQEAVN